VDAHRAVDESHAQLDTALEAYQSMRHRLNERGDAKAAIEMDLERARAEVSTAEAHLNHLLETARRAGVPPGWLREAQERSPAAPTP
jgi:hypothetical protein